MPAKKNIKKKERKRETEIQPTWFSVENDITSVHFSLTADR